MIVFLDDRTKQKDLTTFLDIERVTKRETKNSETVMVQEEWGKRGW